MTDFTMSTDADGIAVISWDCPDKSMNVLNWDALRMLDGLIEQVIADETIKGAIITSGKKRFRRWHGFKCLGRFTKRIWRQSCAGYF